MRKICVSILKILAFLALWTALTAPAVMATVAMGGQDFYAKAPYRVGLEVVLTFAVIAPLVIMARFVDKRPLSTIGFSGARLFDLLTGTILGAVIFAAPLGVLVAIGAARFSPDLAGFSAQGLALGVACSMSPRRKCWCEATCQELWAKYGAWTATIVTTLMFVALHANPVFARRAGPDHRRKYPPREPTLEPRLRSRRRTLARYRHPSQLEWPARPRAWHQCHRAGSGLRALERLLFPGQFTASRAAPWASRALWWASSVPRSGSPSSRSP